MTLGGPRSKFKITLKNSQGGCAGYQIRSLMVNRHTDHSANEAKKMLSLISINKILQNEEDNMLESYTMVPCVTHFKYFQYVLCWHKKWH